MLVLVHERILCGEHGGGRREDHGSGIRGAQVRGLGLEPILIFVILPSRAQEGNFSVGAARPERHSAAMGFFRMGLATLMEDRR